MPLNQITQKQIKNDGITGADLNPNIGIYDETKSYTSGTLVIWKAQVWKAINAIIGVSEGDLTQAPDLATSDWELYLVPANDVTFNNSTNNFDSINVQDAIEEAASGSLLFDCTRKLYVCRDGSDTTGDGSHHNPYLTIHHAVSTITDSSASNNYVINIGVGVFPELPIVLPEGINLTGSGECSTYIEATSESDHAITLNNCSILTSLSIINAPSGFAAIYGNNKYNINIDTLVITDCDIGISIISSDQSGLYCIRDTHFCGSFTNAIKVVGSDTSLLRVNVSGMFTNRLDTNTSPQISVDGDAARFSCKDSIITGNNLDLGFKSTGGSSGLFSVIFDNCLNSVDVLQGYTLLSACTLYRLSNGGTGIKLYSSGSLDLGSVSLQNFTTGILVDNVGLSPFIKGSVSVYSCTNDLNVAHTSASGSIDGILTKSKVTNNSPETLQLVYKDPITGDFNISRVLATRGFATDLTTIVSANQTTQMVSYDSHTYIITGDMEGQIVKLPDATTLRVGHQFRILNESSVDVIVHNYDGVADQLLIPESNTLKILRDNSTTAGVWTKSVSANYITGKLRDPRFFSMNGTVSDGNWISISNLLSDYKYVFTEGVRLIGIEWSNGSGDNRDFDLVFYKNGTDVGNIVRTYSVRSSTYDYGYDTGWNNDFALGDYMVVKYVDQGNNVSDFGGRFNFEVL